MHAKSYLSFYIQIALYSSLISNKLTLKYVTLESEARNWKSFEALNKREKPSD